MRSLDIITVHSFIEHFKLSSREHENDRRSGTSLIIDSCLWDCYRNIGARDGEKGRSRRTGSEREGRLCLREKTGSNTKFQHQRGTTSLSRHVCEVRHAFTFFRDQYYSNQATDLRQKTELLICKIIRYFYIKIFHLWTETGGAPTKNRRRRRRRADA